MKIVRMPYRRYKAHYPDCDTVPGTYDSASKTIDVVVPEEREKPSGVRGQTFHYLEFHGVENGTGRHVTCTVKATCRANAIKRLPRNCVWDLD